MVAYSFLSMTHYQTNFARPNSNSKTHASSVTHSTTLPFITNPSRLHMCLPHRSQFTRSFTRRQTRSLKLMKLTYNLLLKMARKSTRFYSFHGFNMRPKLLCSSPTAIGHSQSKVFSCSLTANGPSSRDVPHSPPHVISPFPSRIFPHRPSP